MVIFYGNGHTCFNDIVGEKRNIRLNERSLNTLLVLQEKHALKWPFYFFINPKTQRCNTLRPA